jgi:hypothetical protein
VRAKLDECFPRLQYVASQSFGSVVGEETSEDGLGYGPIYKVTRYAFSTAFLVTEGFRDTDSLAARMIQSRFTGHYRFACKAWYEWVNDASNSAPGSNNPESKFQADDFNSPYDRNLLLIATVLFDESYRNELCDRYDDSGCDGYAFGLLDPIQFWKEQCESPAGWRNAVPTHMWTRSMNVYTAVEDQMGHAVEDWMIAPMRAYGSLRQLQDVSKELAGAHFPEDFSEMDTRSDSSFAFKSARLQRERWNPFKFYRERICDPEYHMSIEEVAGNAPHWETWIRDTSRAILFNSDMTVPASLRGESNFEGTDNHPNVCPEGEACDLTKKPTYRESSMLQLVYVCRRLSRRKHALNPSRFRIHTIVHRSLRRTTPPSSRASTGCSTRPSGPRCRATSCPTSAVGWRSSWWSTAAAPPAATSGATWAKEPPGLAWGFSRSRRRSPTSLTQATLAPRCGSTRRRPTPSSPTSTTPSATRRTRCSRTRASAEPRCTVCRP